MVAQYASELAEKQKKTEIQNLKIKRAQQDRNYLTRGVFLLLIIIGVVLCLTYLEKFCEGDRLRMKKYIGMFLEAVPGFREQLLNTLESELQAN